MTYSGVVFENNDGVVTIRLNHPNKLNALGVTKELLE
jgi:enoyl-CoA hydratase/carnithine racemase